jgi:hypothetical protein
LSEQDWSVPPSTFFDDRPPPLFPSSVLNMLSSATSRPL